MNMFILKVLYICVFPESEASDMIFTYQLPIRPIQSLVYTKVKIWIHGLCIKGALCHGVLHISYQLPEQQLVES